MQAGARTGRWSPGVRCQHRAAPAWGPEEPGSLGQLDPAVSLAPGSKPFPLYRVSACLGQNGEVPTALTAPTDRLVLVPSIVGTDVLLDSPPALTSSQRSCGAGGRRGGAWAAVATLSPQLH